MTDASIYGALVEACRGERPFALGLITEATGSCPRRPGAKAIFFADGAITGTVGGGALEAEVQRRAEDSLRSGQPAAFEFALDHAVVEGGGPVCGGTVRALVLPHARAAEVIWAALVAPVEPRCWGVAEDFTIRWADSPSEAWQYIETVGPLPALWVAGAGHIAQAVAALALDLDFAVTVFDDRPTWADPRRFPAETHLAVGAWEELLRRPLPSVPTFGLIVTRGHEHDALVLAEWIHRPFAYLGMIGSRRKARIMREHFLAQGLAGAAALDRVHCPVGLPIEAETVPEIAVSIAAQLVQERARLREGEAELSRP